MALTQELAGLEEAEIMFVRALAHGSCQLVLVHLLLVLMALVVLVV